VHQAPNSTIESKSHNLEYSCSGFNGYIHTIHNYSQVYIASIRVPQKIHLCLYFYIGECAIVVCIYIWQRIVEEGEKKELRSTPYLGEPLTLSMVSKGAGGQKDLSGPEAWKWH
jgi:hypothetical protein